ncbi:uncharacterized protein PV07_11314 [Cladophialophora immunda]|uniref:C2H2-type domain-containing protein n=1 Tax=Cladophialophora immunda TaxID=569365 RepID=A0A0D2BVM0_9EURO|nr:uncharacterized protein PV07_11314 [Cladophialophora immunda]KIW23088.1 hypothetical protein PV07_11314 [Cladophialophora immunda]OQU93585.1 hypothetical protein CLAIMM_00072 [Cladophialophora immunda]
MRVESDNDSLDKDYDMLDSDIDDDEDDFEEQVDDTPASTPPSGTLPRCRQKTLKCPYENCDKAFDRRVRLEEHVRSHTNERPFQCPHPPCTKAFFRDSHLKHHVKSQHSNIRDYHCTWEGCASSFTTGTRLRRHLETHEAKERFRCRGYPGCDQTFRKQETLDRHILSVHHNIKPFPCKELDSVTGAPCKKAYDTAENLRCHVRAKHDTSRFSCSDCMAQNAAILADPEDEREVIQASFATYGELQAHLAIVHPPTCQYCPTSFTTNKELTRHLEIQHGILPEKKSKDVVVFTCTVGGCGKKFTKKGNLNVHIKTVHENKRDFVCGKTEIALPEEVADQQDVVIHGCNRSFTSKASLEEHVRTAHLGLESKRMLREKKRKADRRSDDEHAGDSGAGGGRLKKQRRPRSDKGVRRTSAMAGLTGVAAAPADSVAGTSQQEQVQHGFVDIHPKRRDEDADLSNKGTLLSGSMVICDDHIWHNGTSYHYPSGEYPTLLSRDFARASVHDDAPIGDFVHDECMGAEGAYDESDLHFFGEFEPETELVPRGFEYPAP